MHRRNMASSYTLLLDGECRDVTEPLILVNMSVTTIISTVIYLEKLQNRPGAQYR